MKKLFKWLLCAVMGILLMAAGGKLLMDHGIKIGNLPVQTAIAQTISEDILLVNAQHPLPDGFSVDDLVKLYGEKRYFGLAASDICLTREVFEAADQMFHQANQDGVKGFTITSGYRTEEKQRELYENDEVGTAAKPGTSEHQSGLAFDVTTRHDGGGFEETEQFRWLSENCWEFGFILRYPKGKEDITGFPYEPWHYRYVGVKIAQEIHENGWTLEEYCERNGD